MGLQQIPSGAYSDSAHFLNVQADVAGSDQQETVTFIDSTSSYIDDYSAAPSSVTLHDQSVVSDMQKFLTRPVRIRTITWNESDPQGQLLTIQPWGLFLNDTRVKNKLNNFAFLNAKLKVKIMINASPFYYGSVGVSYRPVTDFNNETIIDDNVGNRHLILHSQRPIVWLSPQRNEGAEMTLPFLYYRNWLVASSSSAVNNMGTLTFNVFTPLQSANGVTGAGVTISVYAWMEDLQLSGPSVSLAVQSDEYNEEPFSKKASAAAKAMAKLGDLPVIGKFATAASMGASAVSSIAHLFGYTNVPVIDNSSPMRSEPFPQFASSEISYPIHKLTLDPKNELTIDKSSFGAENVDELVISKLVGRESYLTSSVWTNTNTIDDILFSTPVAPCNMWDLTTATYPRAYLTPMCWVGKLFQSWRGDIIFRLRIIASKYHKGRLIISFDPDGQTGNNVLVIPENANAVMTEILDLDDTNEVEFRVPYQQALPFLLNQNLTTAPNWSTSLTPTFAKQSEYQNGWFTVKVLTALTAPVLSTNVVMQIFVRGAENLEFANPTSAPQGWSCWDVQSDEIVTDSKTSTMGDASHPDAHQYLVNHGERILSLRQNLRRMTFVGATTPIITGTNTLSLYQKYFGKIPPYFGYDTAAGIHTAKGLVNTGTTYKFNFVKTTPLNWINTAFVGYRGSINWSFAVDSRIPLGHVRVLRQNFGSVPFSNVAQDVVTTKAYGTLSENAQFYNQNMEPGGAGMSITHQLTNAGINVQLPMYTNYNFASTSRNRATGPNGGDGELYDTAVLELGLVSDISPSTRIYSYVGVGTDYDPVFFLNVPTFTYIGNGGVPV